METVDPAAGLVDVTDEHELKDRDDEESESQKNLGPSTPPAPDRADHDEQLAQMHHVTDCPVHVQRPSTRPSYERDDREGLKEDPDDDDDGAHEEEPQGLSPHPATLPATTWRDSANGTVGNLGAGTPIGSRDARLGHDAGPTAVGRHTLSNPVQIEESVTISRPAPVVWATVSDYSSDHIWRPEITEMTPDPPGPPAVGTHVREVLRKSGRDYVTESTVVEVEPGMSYRFSGSGTTGKVEGGRTVVEVDAESAIFTYQVTLTLTGATRLLRPVVASSLRKVLRQDLERLRVKLEADELGAGGAE